MGKWHLGFADFRYTPTARGFDTSDGFFTGQQYHFNQSGIGLLCGGSYTEIFKDGVVRADLQGVHDTTRFNATAISIIENHVKEHGIHQDPLFLYVAYNTPHSPIEVDDYYYNLYPSITYVKQRTFYGMVSELDDSVGAIVGALKDHHLWNNTLLVFAGDNGSPIAHT